MVVREDEKKRARVSGAREKREKRGQEMANVRRVTPRRPHFERAFAGSGGRLMLFSFSAHAPPSTRSISHYFYFVHTPRRLVRLPSLVGGAARRCMEERQHNGIMKKKTIMNTLHIANSLNKTRPRPHTPQCNTKRQNGEYGSSRNVVVPMNRHCQRIASEEPPQRPFDSLGS
jgi:hypothetical protein